MARSSDRDRDPNLPNWFVPPPVENMVRTNADYFGLEQHLADLAEFDIGHPDPLQIIGKFQGDWLDELDIAVPLATKDLYKFREDGHNDYLYVTLMSDAMPKISSMAEILGFVQPYHAQIQMQRPGCNMARHKDPALPFHNPQRVRVLIMLAPWEQGQYLFFNSTVFSRWDSGTIIHTDFENVWHSTTNTSWHTRPILQITGVPNENLRQLINSRQQQTFQV